MRHLQTLFFEPLDVLVFRDHRPFLAGQHFLARSVFPSPSVFFGALRAALFERAGVVFTAGGDPFQSLSKADRELLGDAVELGLLELRGPFLAREGGERVLLPWPADLELREVEATKVRVVLRIPSDERGGLRWSGAGLTEVRQKLPQEAEAKGEKPSKERLLLTLAGARAYAAASASGRVSFELAVGDEVVCEKEVLVKERRTGVSLRRAEEGADPRVVEESMLFTVETWRMAQGTGFAIDLGLAEAQVARHGPRLHALVQQLVGATLRLGGKGHRVRVRGVPGPLLAGFDGGEGSAVGSQDGVKLWALTPWLFDPAGPAEPTMVLGTVIRLGSVALRASPTQPRGPRPLVGALERGAVVFWGAPPDFDHVFQADERGREYGHPRQAGYGVHRVLPFRRSFQAEVP